VSAPAHSSLALPPAASRPPSRHSRAPAALRLAAPAQKAAPEPITSTHPHFGDLADVPARDVLVELRCVVEHILKHEERRVSAPAHSSLASPPAASRPPSRPSHAPAALHLAATTQTATPEPTTSTHRHRGDFADVPARDVLVERRCVVEHRL